MTSRTTSHRFLAIASLFLFIAAAAAQSLSGVVTNRTNGKPAQGDDVVLLKLAQGMQELARAKTDGRGRFTIKLPDDGLHLLRVTHDGANYFKPVQPGTQSVEIDVYSASPTVEGITIAEDVLQVQTEPAGNSLRVIEHFLVKNDSSPATTLFSEHPFELNLPPGATIEGAAAKAPGGMAVQQPVVPMGPDHYTLLFPLRPGETEFTVWYHVPYKDSITLHPKPTMDTANLAVMMPTTMKFKSGAQTTYAAVTEDLGGSAQAFVARDVHPSQPLDFTISGTGVLPKSSPAAASGGGAAPAATSDSDPNADKRPGVGLGTPLDREGNRESWVSKYRWVLIGVLFLAMAAGAGVMLMRKPEGAVVVGAAPPLAGPGRASPAGALQVLRDEMFAVETDRLEGRLNEAQYAELKSAFDIVLRRTLERSGTARVVSE